jgi:hypothetical protein
MYTVCRNAIMAKTDYENPEKSIRRTIYKGSELLGDLGGRAVYRSLRGLFKASFIWKDTSDLCKPPSGVFPRSLSLGHH